MVSFFVVFLGPAFLGGAFFAAAFFVTLEVEALVDFLAAAAFPPVVFFVGGFLVIVAVVGRVVRVVAVSLLGIRGEKRRK